MELGTNVPFIHSILSSRLVQALAGPKPEDKKGLGAIVGVAQKIVAERFDPNNEKHAAEDRDMLDAFIKYGLNQLEAESESMLQILAGSDSTATTIRMTLLLLLTNPRVYRKLQTEIDVAIADGKITFPVVQNAEALQLPYLQAVIKEGLRLWQPLNGIVTKDSPNEDITINNVYIPANTQVCLSSHSMMRRMDLFGPDPDIFRPERWLDTDTDRIKEAERIWELTFGTGRFTCLGKSLALMELNKVFVEVCIISLTSSPSMTLNFLWQSGESRYDELTLTIRTAPETLRLWNRQPDQYGANQVSPVACSEGHERSCMGERGD